MLPDSKKSSLLVSGFLLTSFYDICFSCAPCLLYVFCRTLILPDSHVRNPYLSPNNSFLRSNRTRKNTMSNTSRGLPLTSSRVEQIFPILTPAQINRIAVHGHMRAVEPGKVLVEQGDSTVPFFVVVSGELEIVRPSCAGETLVTIHGPGQFTGEVNMLSGRRTLVRMRATNPGN